MESSSIWSTPLWWWQRALTRWSDLKWCSFEKSSSIRRAAWHHWVVVFVNHANKSSDDFSVVPLVPCQNSWRKEPTLACPLWRRTLPLPFPKAKKGSVGTILTTWTILSSSFSHIRTKMSECLQAVGTGSLSKLCLWKTQSIISLATGTKLLVMQIWQRITSNWLSYRGQWIKRTRRNGLSNRWPSLTREGRLGTDPFTSTTGSSNFWTNVHQ